MTALWDVLVIILLAYLVVEFPLPCLVVGLLLLRS